jgi:hypothetical protein
MSCVANPVASGAGLNLGKADDALQKSLSRLSRGRRIVNYSDDAGGLAVSMKMAAAQKRMEATAINFRNIQSYLDSQDGAFKIADKVLSRMWELTTLARDVTKNSAILRIAIRISKIFKANLQAWGLKSSMAFHFFQQILQALSSLFRPLKMVRNQHR